MSRQLQEIPEFDVSMNYKELEAKIPNLWWDERTKVGMMNDKHLANAINKLQGNSVEQYEGSDGLKSKWIYALKLEQIRREDSRKNSFNKDKTNA